MGVEFSLVSKNWQKRDFAKCLLKERFLNAYKAYTYCMCLLAKTTMTGQKSKVLYQRKFQGIKSIKDGTIAHLLSVTSLSLVQDSA